VVRGEKHELEHNLHGVVKWDWACLTKVVQNPSKGAAAALGRNKGNCFLKSEWNKSVKAD